jgi:hypothetical protein
LCGLDSSNAFNTVSRAAIAESIASSPFPELLPLFDLCHKVEGLLRVKCTDGSFTWLHSSEGAQQGDVLGPLFFAMALQPVLVSVQKAHPEVLITAYLDDVNALGATLKASDASLALVAALPAIGLQVNVSKSFVYSSSDLPPDLFQGMEVITEGTRVLGAPVGSAGFQQRFVAGKLKAAATAVQQVLQFSSKQVALMMLRYCAVSSPVMLMRTVFPEHMHDAAAAFDEEIRSCLSSLLGVPLSDQAWLQASLPLRPGLGLSLAVDTCLPAFSASWLHFCSQAPAMFPLLGPSLEAIASSPLARVHGDAIALRGAAKAKPSAHPHSDLTATLQSKMASVFVEKRADALFLSASPAGLARLHSASGKGAASWLCAIPSVPELFLPSSHFVVAVSLLLGLPVCSEASCLCGNVADPLGVHFLTCKHLGGPISRHDRMVNEFCRLIRAAGVVVEKEALHYLDDGSRLDFVAHSMGERSSHLVGDMKVVCPVVPSRILASSREPLSTALAGEKQKVKKYGAACAAKGMSFTPVVFECFGSASPAAEKLISRLIAKAVGEGSWEAPNWAASSPAPYWWQRLSVALQRYNAQMILRLSAATRAR